MSALDRLKDAYYKANSAEAIYINGYRQELHAKLTAATEAVQSEMTAKHGPTLEALAATRSAAETEWTIEKERVALSGDGSKYPIGTILYEWEHDHGRYMNCYYEGPGLCPKHKLSGRKAVVEPVTRDSKFSGVLSRYSRPEVGTFIARKFKKDGKSPSTAFVDLDKEWESRNWLLEGETPLTRKAKEDAEVAA